jgi:phosphatidylserine synthase
MKANLFFIMVVIQIIFCMLAFIRYAFFNTGQSASVIFFDCLAITMTGVLLSHYFTELKSNTGEGIIALGSWLVLILTHKSIQFKISKSKRSSRSRL